MALPAPSSGLNLPGTGLILQTTSEKLAGATAPRGL
tara:strand:+ start:5035 stop:5142 length:108 start_codon:yes stop_codon:yes gene_type:complete